MMRNYNPSDRQKVYARVLAKNGPITQITKCVEEMAELIKELCKSMAGAPNLMHIAEEIADVQITVEQMIQIYRIEEMVIKCRNMKMDSLEKRIG